MEIIFDKYHGTGNDFIILDNRDGRYSGLKDHTFKAFCNRYKGIGADGTILLQERSGVDFEMLYFNADGNQSSFCGNGARCLVAYAHKKGIINKRTKLKAKDGIHEAILLSTNQVRLNIKDVSSLEKYKDAVLINTGSPHYIKLVEDASLVNVNKEGKLIRFSDRFNLDGINVNFISKINNNRFLIRTYERGVENETLACGTGAVAGALVLHYLGETSTKKELVFEARGGILRVGFEFVNQQYYSKIFLQGPATFVYTGIINI